MDIDRPSNLGVGVRSHPPAEFLVVVFSDHYYLYQGPPWCHVDNLLVIILLVTRLAELCIPIYGFLDSLRVLDTGHQ